MVEDDFLKEKQNIREKMLKYSRAIKEGRPYEDLEHNFNESDRILKNRIHRKKRPKFTDFDEEYEEEKPKKHSTIYLKEDLINVKLEEKKPFMVNLNFFKKIKKTKKEKSKKTNNNKTTKINAETKIDQNEKIKKNNFKGIKFKTILMQNTSFVFQNIKKIKIIKNKKQEKKQVFKDDLNHNEEKIILKENSTIQENLSPKQNSTTQEISPLSEDKYELLEGIKTEENKNLSPKNLLYAFVMVIFALMVFFPQIYIRNQIYYTSRDIADLRSQEWVLDEENKELKRKLEALYFQNQVLDFLD